MSNNDKNKINISGNNNHDNNFNIEDNSIDNSVDIHDNTFNITKIISGDYTNKPDKVDRPCLENYYNKRKNNQGKTRIYRFYGYLTGGTRVIKTKRKFLTKVLNVITSDGIYVDDHIWLDIEPKKYMKEYNKYRKEKGTLTGFVEFEGYVNQYKRQNGSIGSEIIIVRPVIFHNDKLESIGIVTYKLIEDEKLQKYAKYTREKLFNLVDKLQDELNELINYYGDNFVFFYIINLIFINTAKENLYKNKITRIPMSEKVIRQIIQTMASLIYMLDTSKAIDLETILKYTTNIVNVLQGIENYEDRSNEFNEFCENELGILDDSRQSENIWDKVVNRKRNFGENPNPFNLTKESISLQTWKIIYKYI